jgi:hypothetical protein
LEKSNNYWDLGLEREDCLKLKILWEKTYVLANEIIKNLAIWDDI